MATTTPPAGAVATTERRPIDVVKAMLDGKKSDIAVALPKGYDVERFMMQVVAACAKNQDLLDCDKGTILLAAMQAAELGIDFSGTLGAGYLVPYKKTCQFIPGYRGLIDLAIRSGLCSFIESHVVRLGDVFDYEYGLAPFLKHKPKTTPSTPANANAEDLRLITHVYAVGTLTSGAKIFEVMDRAAIDAVRKIAKTDKMWGAYFSEMCRKTVVRRLFKYMPVSAINRVVAEQLNKAIELDNASYDVAGTEAPEFVVPVPVNGVPVAPMPAAAHPGADEGKPKPTPVETPASAEPVPAEPAPAATEQPAAEEPPMQAIDGKNCFGDYFVHEAKIAATGGVGVEAWTLYAIVLQTGEKVVTFKPDCYARATAAVEFGLRIRYAVEHKQRGPVVVNIWTLQD